MHFARDAPVGPTGLPWRAWLLAHGAFPPGEHVWSRSRRQREVWSRFLPSAWSSFGGALWPTAGAKRIVRWFPRQVSASPGAILHSSGRSNADETLAGGTGSRAAAGSPQGGDTSETGGDGDTALGYGVGEPYTLCHRSAPDALTHWLPKACGRQKLGSLGWGGRSGLTTFGARRCIIASRRHDG
jgi:hypothetical protein